MKLLPFLLVLLISFTSIDSNAQLRNLGKRIQKKVNDRVNRRFDQGVDKGLDEVEKGIGDAADGEGDAPPDVRTGEGAPAPAGTADTSPAGETTGESAASGDFQVNTKFDYVPGELLMVFEDFEEDAIGDFPARWNTDGTGEVVTFGNSQDKWFQMKSGSDYIPDLPKTLPEEYTIEFDVAARGLDQKTSSNAVLEIALAENNVFNSGRNWVRVKIPFCQYHKIGFNVRNHVDGKRVISNTVDGDIRKQVLNQPHVSIAVNKTRFRFWVNEKKYVDVPRLVPSGNTIKYIKFTPHGFKDGKEDIYIRNLKIAEGGLIYNRNHTVYFVRLPLPWKKAR
jgi:hypothetical protein